MRIFYPYNEILPRRKAHDVFLFQECAALANAGHTVTLGIGRGSLPNAALLQHYGVAPHTPLDSLQFPIVRKNYGLPWSWNLPFFLSTQRYIERTRPDWVVLSVRKQGAYHLQRKVPGVRYLYEVHELAAYPGLPPHKQLPEEIALLQAATCITVTTEALRTLLLAPPYSLSVPIEVVPLAVSATPLPSHVLHTPPRLYYVGQLYNEQGLGTLLEALHQKPTACTLTVVGGDGPSVEHWQARAAHLGIEATFTGFVPPAQLPCLLAAADAFVAPFEPVGRMPYVAHTKLYEYASWGRPFIAPDLPSVRSHFGPETGALLYSPPTATALAEALKRLFTPTTYASLAAALHTSPTPFSWPSRAQRYNHLWTFDD